MELSKKVISFDKFIPPGIVYASIFCCHNFVFVSILYVENIYRIISISIHWKYFKYCLISFEHLNGRMIFSHGQ